jgi:hypothetical protein
VINLKCAKFRGPTVREFGISGPKLGTLCLQFNSGTPSPTQSRSTTMTSVQMDVDRPTSLPSSSSKRPVTSFLPSSSTEKRAKHLLPLAQQTMLNEKMEHYSHSQKWRYLIQKAEDDDSAWQGIVFSSVLTHLAWALAGTGMKSSIISINPDNPADILNSFNEDELKQWKAGVYNGLEKNDWIGLMTHRTYISDYRIVGSRLIVNRSETQTAKNPECSLGGSD